MTGDGLSEDRSVRWDEVDEAVRKSGLLEDLVDPEVGQDCRVARLPDDAVALKLFKIQTKIPKDSFSFVLRQPANLPTCHTASAPDHSFTSSL